MALAPLFVSSHALLRANLRLTALETGTDALAILDDAILSVRMRFVARLTIARCDAILDTTFTSTPTTNDEFLRALASVCETKMVRLELMTTLPTAFMDAGGDIQKRWNEEAPFREIGVDKLEAVRVRLEAEIEEALQFLEGEDFQGEDTSISTWDGAPENETPRIGDSLERTWGDSINLLQTEW